MIPALIHFVWTTRDDLKPLNKHCIKSWLEKTNYSMKLWAVEDILKLPIPEVCKKVLTNDYVHWVLKSDIIRFLVIYYYGGIYADTDMECLKPLDLFLQDKSFAGESYPLNNIGNAIFGSEPLNLLFLGIATVTAEIIQDGLLIANKPHPEWTIDRQGPMLQEVQRVYAKEFFYPLSWYDTRGSYDKEVAYTLHHWQGSLKDGWIKDTY